MRLFCLGLATLAVHAAAAQPVSTSPFQTQRLPLSAEAQAVSEAGSFGEARDPVQFLRNPALLADFSSGVSVGGMLTPDWLVSDIRLGSLAVAAGIETTVARWPATVGAGLAYGSIDFGPIPRTTTDPSDPPTATDEVRDDMAALGVGLGIAGPVRVRVGAGARRLRSAPDLWADGDAAGRRAHALTGDLGLDVTAPVGDWLRSSPVRSGLQVALDVSAGTAVRGLVLANEPLSDDVYTHPDRLTAAGVGVAVGLDLSVAARPVRIASLELLAEGEAQAGYGDLTPGAVLLGAGSDDEGVAGRRALRIVYGETLGLSLGRLSGANYVDRWTGGLTLSLGGAARLAGALTSDPGLYTLGQRLDLRYTYALLSFTEDSPFGGTGTHGVVVRVRP